MKTCPDCRETFPATTEFFYRAGAKYLRQVCKSCWAQRGKRYSETERGREVHRVAQRRHAIKPHRREDHRVREKARYWANREERSIRARARYQRDRALVLARVLAYRLKNPEAIRERSRRWKRAHMDRVLHSIKQRKLVLLGRGTFTYREWQEKKMLLGNVCFYCGESKPLTRDHKIPLSRGGTNTIENILPACLSCNVRKARKTAAEFIQSRQLSVAS